MYFNWKDHFSTGCIVVAIIFIMQSGFIIYDAFRDYGVKCELERVNENLKQVVADSETPLHQISLLKEDKHELYKALASCNFLRETENLPIGEINKDIVKGAFSYGNAEGLVTKALEKYKEE